MSTRQRPRAAPPRWYRLLRPPVHQPGPDSRSRDPHYRLRRVRRVLRGGQVDRMARTSARPARRAAGWLSLMPPPVDPPLTPSFQTVSLVMFLPEECKVVPPQARTKALEAGKSTVRETVGNLVPGTVVAGGAGQTVTPMAAAAWKPSLTACMAAANRMSWPSANPPTNGKDGRLALAVVHVRGSHRIDPAALGEVREINRDPGSGCDGPATSISNITSVSGLSWPGAGLLWTRSTDTAVTAGR